MTDDYPISAGLVKYNSKDQVESLEYYTGFFTGGGNSVIYKFKNGKVSSITLSYGYM